MLKRGAFKLYDPHRPGLWFAVFVIVTAAIGFLGMPEVPTPSSLDPYLVNMGPALIVGFAALWLCHQFRKLQYLFYVRVFLVAGFLIGLYLAVIH